MQAKEGDRLSTSTVIAAIALAWLLDSCILARTTPCLAKCFAGFACGVELWSFLENCTQLSDAPFFRLLQRYVRHRIDREFGADDERGDSPR